MSLPHPEPGAQSTYLSELAYRVAWIPPDPPQRSTACHSPYTALSALSVAAQAGKEGGWGEGSCQCHVSRAYG